MKWRKQMTAMWDDERVARLVKAGGSEGLAAFGLYCRLLDIVASQMEGKTPKCSVSYDVSRWSLLLSLRGSHVRHWLDKLAVTTLLTAEWDGTEVRVTIPNLLKYRDEYSKKSGQNPHKEQNRTEEEHIQTTSARVAVDVARATSPKIDDVEQWYNDQFYPIFPLHKSRAEGLAAARKHLRTPELRAIALSAIKFQSTELLTREPSKRPHPSTWINGKRWEDELIPQQQVLNGTSGGYKPGREIVVERPVD